MVGGTAAASPRATPILDAMGKAVIHAGGPGTGQAAKICNNMMLGASMIGTCEGFVLAQKLGLDLQTFFDISSQILGAVLVDDDLLPGSRPGPGVAGKPRL